MTECTILNCFSVMIRYLSASCLMSLVVAPGPRNVSILKTNKRKIKIKTKHPLEEGTRVFLLFISLSTK